MKHSLALLAIALAAGMATPKQAAQRKAANNSGDTQNAYGSVGDPPRKAAFSRTWKGAKGKKKGRN